MPTLFGPEQADREQEKHKYLYWEFHERGFKQAVREGTWKAIRFGVDGPIELYDLQLDMGETDNLADKHPATVARLAGYMDEAHTDSPDWPLPNAKDPSGQ